MTEKKKPGPEAIVREIKRNTRRKFSAEEKIRIVLEVFTGIVEFYSFNGDACHLVGYIKIIGV